MVYTEKQLKEMSVKDAFNAAKTCEKDGQYQEAITLYEHVTFRVSTGSPEWTKSHMKMGNINAKRCLKVQQDQVFAEQEAAKIKLSSSDDQATKIQCLVSMWHADANEHYNQAIEKTVNILKLLKEKTPDFNTTQLQTALQDKISTMLAFDYQFYKYQTRNMDERSEHAVEYMQGTLRYLSDVASTTLLTYSDSLQTHFTEYGQFIDLLGKDGTIVSLE